MPDGDAEVSGATKDAEETEAKAQHVADREPSRDEETAADESAPEAVDDDVRAHEEEMMRRGVEAKGEARI
jgi:hypothetical protein